MYCLKWGIMANMVLCVIPGQGNSKILNLVKSVFSYSRDIEITRGYIIQELSKKMPVPNALSMISANWARPGQPLWQDRWSDKSLPI